MKKLILFIFLLSVTTGSVYSQDSLVVRYIEMYKDIAMKEMKRVGIPASITLAQGIIESQYGTGALVQRSNNHFGIKCKSTWTGDTVRHNDDAKNECFRKYLSATDSYIDHSNFLVQSYRYKALFTLSVYDYKGWASGLQKAGYATNRKYADILIKCIEKYRLEKYDREELERYVSNDY